MAHAHEHDHHGDDYFLDQLCLIALSGAFGAICLTMFFWKGAYLSRILAPQFYNFILWSGVALILLFLIRAAAVWKLAGKEGVGHSHDHHHEHAHGDHHHHAHGHDHAHDHAHGHDHDHAQEGEPHHYPPGHAPAYDDGHEHGFAPWRYVVLIVPIVLFFLDLPREKRIPKTNSTMNLSQEAGIFSSLVGAGFDPMLQICMFGAYYSDRIDPTEVVPANFQDLEKASYAPESRNFWKGQAVKVIGKFSQSQNDHMFKLVRYKIACCGSDAIPLDVEMICKESVADFKHDEWVEVVGRVDFQLQPNGRYLTLLRIPKKENIQPIPPPKNPYIQ